MRAVAKAVGLSDTNEVATTEKSAALAKVNVAAPAAALVWTGPVVIACGLAGVARTAGTAAVELDWSRAIAILSAAGTASEADDARASAGVATRPITETEAPASSAKRRRTICINEPPIYACAAVRKIDRPKSAAPLDEARW